ncbi:MAG: barstar family protein [Tissierellia bacterium]|nr:barstar family protein [Tissierellia bacterium]
MRRISLDGKMMTDKENTHIYLKEKLELPDYYGNNLDALWDLLSFESRPTEIQIINISMILKNLGDYGYSLIEVFSEVNHEGGRVKSEFIY